MEAQAVARVQRIGQTQETFVHYVIADNTIESKMCVLLFLVTLSYSLFEERKLNAANRRTYGKIEGETLTGKELDDLLMYLIC